MSASRRRPTGPPPSAGVLAKYVQAYGRELGVAEGRVRAWVAYMIMAGALDRAKIADSPFFILKGGVALELRLRDRARATKDIDIVLRDTNADLADSLEDQLTGEPYQGFSSAERDTHSCWTTVRSTWSSASRTRGSRGPAWRRHRPRGAR